MTNKYNLVPTIKVEDKLSNINLLKIGLLKTGLLIALQSSSVTKDNNSLSAKKMSLMACLVGISLLTGCTDRVMLAEENMAEIRASQAQAVEPPPEPVLVEDYVYDAINVRSPFMPPSLLNLKNKVISESDVAPDLTRTKEPLESYDLSALSYRGMVVSPEGEKFGLIQRPDGIVDSVKVGDYMGTNDGRIVEITSTQINLIEIVSDNRGGFIEQPASVVSPI